MNRELTNLLKRVAPWVLVGMFAGQSVAQRHVDVSPGSSMWIEGRSNVNSFRCTTEAIEGHGMIANTGTGGVRAASVVLTAGIDTFDCGKQGMNRDMQKALKAEEFPEIRFELDSASIDPDFASSVSHQIVARGRLTLAGRERPVDMTVTAEPLPNKGFRVTGSLPLLMTDYGVKPPRKVLGLIRVRDAIVVHFDISTTQVAE